MDGLTLSSPRSRLFGVISVLTLLLAVSVLHSQQPRSAPVPPRIVQPPRLETTKTIRVTEQVVEPQQPETISPDGAHTPAPEPPARRFQFKFDPQTPLKDLLPTAPKITARKPALIEDLSQVPEVSLQEPYSSKLDPEKSFEQIAHQVAKVNHLNKKTRDHFISALLEERTDLRGLPFAMGDACRSGAARARQFSLAVNTLRQGAPRTVPQPAPRVSRKVAVEEDELDGDETDLKWAELRVMFDRADRHNIGEEARQHASPARVAALMQIFSPEGAKERLSMVKYLAGISCTDSTRALARLVLFTPDEEVRKAAVAALQVRRERDYTDILLDGFRYPLPVVARRAAEALVQLDRKDTAVQLVGVLDEPDPRAPVTKMTKGKSVSTMRELVRINHHRNCLMCHAPANGEQPPETLTADIAVPNQPLPTPGEGYNSGSPDTAVRIDVTYLRQDFSLMQPVAGSHPWPEMQRFDFLVRTRELSESETADYQKLFKRESGVLPPNQRAALLALRELTGKDAAPTSAAWRELLGQPGH